MILVFIVVSAVLVFFINEALNSYCAPPCKEDVCVVSAGDCSLPSWLFFAEESFEQINRFIR